MSERRRHQRARSFALGAIRDRGPERPSGGTARDRGLDCIVRNLSDGGALLLLEAPRAAPAALVLAVPGAAKAARVVWRGEDAVGIAFAPEATSAPTNVASLADERRRRASDGARLAERIARFVGRPRPGLNDGATAAPHAASPPTNAGRAYASNPGILAASRGNEGERWRCCRRDPACRGPC